MKKDRKNELFVNGGLARISACCCEVERLSGASAEAAMKAAVIGSLVGLSPAEEERTLLSIAAFLTTASGLREAADCFEKTANLLNTVHSNPINEGLELVDRRDEALERLGTDVTAAVLADIESARQPILNAIVGINQAQIKAIQAKWDALEADQATDQEPEDTDEDFGSCQCSACQAEAQNEQPDPAA